MSTECITNKHCWHVVRWEDCKAHSNEGHGPSNTDLDEIYTMKGNIVRCCFCGEEVWVRIRA